MSKQNNLSVLLKGILRENPVFVLILGTCPTLATTTSVISALAMGFATMAVLICSNIFISLLRKLIPDEVRIPCYIVVIAGFVTLVQMFMHAFLPDLYEMLGVYLALITVNCIILGRAEMFAGKNTASKAALDGIGMGIGFVLALLSISTIREVLGAGSFAGIPLPLFSTHKISIMTQAPGGLLVYGIMIAVVNKITKGKLIKKKEFSCAGCPTASVCHCNCAENAKEDK